MSSAAKWGLFFGFLAVVIRIGNILAGNTSDNNLVSAVASSSVFVDAPATGILAGWAAQFGWGFIIGYAIGRLLSWRRIQPKRKQEKPTV